MAAILEAASQLLVERGYAAASTNAISQRAGVSVGSLYQYFAGKTDIYEHLRRLHRCEIHPLVERALEELESSPVAPGVVIARLLEWLVLAHSERPDLMRAMDSELGCLGADLDASEEEAAIGRVARALLKRGTLSEQQASSCAWLAVVVTAIISKRLAHSPPDGLDIKSAIGGFRRMMEGLFDPGGHV